MEELIRGVYSTVTVDNWQSYVRHVKNIERKCVY